MSVGEPSLAPPPHLHRQAPKGDQAPPQASARDTAAAAAAGGDETREAVLRVATGDPAGFRKDFMAQNSISERFHGDFTISINIYK